MNDGNWVENVENRNGVVKVENSKRNQEFEYKIVHAWHENNFD
jgi:hypothetical protein